MTRLMSGGKARKRKSRHSLLMSLRGMPANRLVKSAIRPAPSAVSHWKTYVSTVTDYTDMVLVNSAPIRPLRQGAEAMKSAECLA